jgi:hypothetical protein
MGERSVYKIVGAEEDVTGIAKRVATLQRRAINAVRADTSPSTQVCPRALCSSGSAGQQDPIAGDILRFFPSSGMIQNTSMNNTRS